MTQVELREISGSPTAVPRAEVQALSERLRGGLVGPDNPEYDAVRAVWNGMIDKRPGLIARCTGTADVMAAVDFARRHQLLVAVRGGGHNVSGNAVCDGGLVVDLSPARSVRVDPEAHTAQAQGGATIGDLDRETLPDGLAVPMGVVPETGIAGLTLGGGMGWLRRRYGLSSDNLLSADVVTADGRLVRAGPRGDAELLWALQGGGGNFGVVTSFEYRAHPVGKPRAHHVDESRTDVGESREHVGPEVFFAVVMHAAADVRRALRFYREWQSTAPDEVSAFAILWHAPEIDEIPAEFHGTPIVLFLAMHCGSPAEGERVLEPLRAHGSPLADLSSARPYLAVQRFFDGDYPAHTMRYYWKSRYLGALPDEAIDLLVAFNEESPTPESTIDLWQLGGAIGRVAPDATAFGDRSAPFLLGVETNWHSTQDDTACLAWARKVYSAMERYSTGKDYVNFPGFYEDHDSLVRDTFGGNLTRLTALKQRYDPQNLFRLNHNIRPG